MTIDGRVSKFGSEKGSETRLHARPVSRGVAVGKVVTIHGDNKQFYRTPIRPEQVDREIARYRAAHTAAARQLTNVGHTLEYSSNSAAIFDMHRAILEDSSLSEKIESVIAGERINAEWAVKLVTDEYIARYQALTDEHFRDRYIDVEDIADQLQTALGGKRHSIRIPRGSIIAAAEIRPSTIAELGSQHLGGIITESGGWTSHSFILARELDIPAVTGVQRLLRRVRTGDVVLLDGFDGTVFLNPDDSTVEAIKATRRPGRRRSADEPPLGDTTQTLDGREIKIRANFDIAASFHHAKDLGARGIGLFRSEYLFNRFKGFPGEAEQIKAYREIGDYAGADRARIRTFDLSLSQIVERSERRDKNPALGLRGVRLSLTHQKHFRTQIRALLQASVDREIDVIIPMVSGVDEVRAVRSIVDEESESLIKRGTEIGSPRLGAMIELPASVFSIDQLLEELDCICIGTNDLVQYTLGVDRDNESVANWFRSLHPSVLEALKRVIEAAAKKDIPAVVCGEMAGSPFYVPILLGLGATELSMNVNSITRVRRVITGVAFEETRELRDRVLACSTVESVESTALQFVEERWGHLFETELLGGFKAPVTT
ncbi:MAG: phosphoenolpyruvate--protein phosphotransferase [bacterium]|nr:phosphoenolpyruvate--protein phosphotransferase [bacterium]